MNIKIEREIKKVTNEKNQEGVSVEYKWETNLESLDNRIEDLQLFCISIVKNIIENNFHSDITGTVKYEDVEIKKTTLTDLQKLYDHILDNLLSRSDEAEKIRRIFLKSKN